MYMYDNIALYYSKKVTTDRHSINSTFAKRLNRLIEFTVWGCGR